MSPLLRRTAVLFTLLLTALTALTVPASAAQETVRRDPADDVKAVAAARADQAAAVDLRKVTYSISDTEVRLVATYADLVDDVKGNQHLETRFTDGDLTFSLFSDLGAKRVMVFDGDHLYRCKHSTVKTDLDQDTIEQRFPVSCITFYTTSAKARTESLLTRDNGSTLAHDPVRSLSIDLG